MRGGSSSSGSDSRRGLMRDDALGITFEHCGADEAEFLYEEIFTRRAYLQGGVQFPLTNTPSEPAVVVDAGANIGLFSLHCLALAPRATIIAVEPSPTAFTALERNLSGHARAACERLCLADVPAPARRLVEYAGATGESTSRPRERAALQWALHERAVGLGGAPRGGAVVVGGAQLLLGAEHRLALAPRRFGGSTRTAWPKSRGSARRSVRRPSSRRPWRWMMSAARASPRANAAAMASSRCRRRSS